MTLRLFNVNPLACLCRFENGVADILGAEGIAEIGVGFFGTGVIETLHKLDGSVDEGVLVAKAESGDPPIAGVGVVAI